MGSATPPKRMTRARAAAASSAATALSPKATKLARVTKATKSTKTTAASTKKATATVKKAAVKEPAATTTAKKSTTVKEPTATATAKKSTITKKPAAAMAAKKTETSETASTSATSTSTTAPAPTATARPTTRKRKLRTFDDNDDDDEDELSREDNAQRAMNQPAKKPRGPAKKAVDPDTSSKSESGSQPQSKHQSDSEEEDAQSTSTTTRATRGRAKKPAAAAATTASTATTTSRTRTRKATAKTDDTASVAVKKPAKKTARGRAVTGTITTTYNTEPTPGLKSAVSRPASKATSLKKTVTFEEPEKENVVPKAAAKAKTETTGTTATGMRAKPVRKPATSGRTTRASARATTEETTEKKPLSPKKDGQNLPLSRDPGSDDELATFEKTPLKPLMKSPVKPPSAIKKLELPPIEKEKDENSTQSLEPALGSVFSSPARRPPPSPFKDAMKSPAKRVDAVPALVFPSTNSEGQAGQSPPKPTMLQSPAKRPHLPLQAFQLNQEQVGAARSPTKISLLNTPAKRPASPIKLLGTPIPSIEDNPKATPQEVARTPMEEISEEELQSQIRAETGAISPDESSDADKLLEPIIEADNEDSIQLESPTPQLSFPGRLSAVLPRHADPALKKDPLLAPQPIVQPRRSSSPEAVAPEPTAVAEAESPKDEQDAESSIDESTTLPESTPEKQHASERVSESKDELADVHEAECTDYEQFPDPQTAEQHAPPCGAESKEQSMDANEPKSEQPSMGNPEVSAKEPAIPGSTQVAPPRVTIKQPGFGLRAKDSTDHDMSDSEDELAFSNKMTSKHQDDASASDAGPATPAPPLFKGTERKITESAARAASRAIRSVSKGSGLGYTPLSVQLSAWRASSPIKGRQSPQKRAAPEDDEDEFSLLDESDFPVVETPATKGFFEDEMKIRADMENHAAMEAFLEADIAAKFDKHDFNDLGLMDEDDSLIAEDDGMSLVTTRGSDESRLHTESVSEASQEYGNENSVPIDPALLGTKTDTTTNSTTPVTPKRTFASREVHTVSKVPLKRADDSPPRNVKRICSTASKPSILRSTDPSANTLLPVEHVSQTGADADLTLGLATPSKAIPRPSVGTPARTTRPDLNSTLLRGAIVFVDVHTTEGADAGRIFVDLLLQMGARCVKSWPWNPASPTDGGDVSKIGITHVVFKDGGKRTLEKVIESNGAVQCVGVSWVLDCEKENRWVAEKDYRVDTSLIPRGGHNRRKSMEPKAIANMNGTLITPVKLNPGPSREPQTVPNNYMSRRETTVWMHSPSEHDEDEDAPSEPSEMDWESTDAPILTPVPKTPAPEMVAKFAMDVSPDASTAESFDSSPDRDQLLMRTCPPKQGGLINLGESLVERGQDQSVMMRLMAARRKSMQFAPKVASPLKKQWKQMD